MKEKIREILLQSLKENNIEKIYYLNILNERKENTKEYLEIVDILKNFTK